MNHTESKPTIVAADNVTKDFHVPHANSSSLKELLTHPSMILNKGYDSFRALEDVSLDVKEGDFFGVVGRNGSGKSTLLKILAGIYKPTEGRVRTRGKIVPFIELGVGFNNELSARDNVYLNGAMLGFTRQEVAKLYDEIVEFAELEDFMEQKLKNFSSGMRVRLAFSIAVKAEADVLLIDEVLAVGDAAFQKKCFQYFRHLKSEHKTVVFVTHDMSAVKKYCNRAMVIEQSHVVFEGDPYEAADIYYSLFEEKTAKKPVKSTKKPKKRTGTREITHTKITVDAAPNGSSEIMIKANFSCKKDVSSPVFGFAVRNEAGAHLFGTSTKVIGKKMGSLKVGDKGSVSWKIPPILNDGNYAIDLGISSSDGIEQIERWNDAATLRIERRDRTPYPVNPVVEFEVEGISET